jgi:transcriptional regulator with XRE-family HTH domain
MSLSSKRETKKLMSRSENPDSIDIYVGSRLRMRRNLVGLSQQQLGKSLGLTFQQIQKYEHGINRMGSSCLFRIAKTLSVPVAYFFDELPPSISLPWQPGFADNEPSPLEKAACSEQQNRQDIMRCRETLKLIRAYYRIQDTKQRRKVYELICSMADEE